MSRFSKNDQSRAKAAALSPLMSAWAPRSAMFRMLTTEELEHRAATFARFTRNIVEFRQGRQSSCRGAWTSREYSEVRVMLRQVPKAKALEMYMAQLRDVASLLTSGICAQSEHPAGCMTVVEQYLNAWQVYSYVCPRAACVLREMQLQPGRTSVRGINAFAERDSDYRVQGIRLFSQALAVVEPQLLLAFGELVRQCFSGVPAALDCVPVLKCVVSSYIHMHDCAPLFSEFLPQEALRSATSSMQIQPVDDETLIYSCSGGLEDTILKTVRSWFQQQISNARTAHSFDDAMLAIRSSAERIRYLLDSFAHSSTQLKLQGIFGAELARSEFGSFELAAALNSLKLAQEQ